MRSRLETRTAPSVACRAEAPALGSKGKGYRTVEFEGFEILVGKADADNDRLTFGIAEPRDFWLHVSGPAGSHVIVRNPFDLDELPRAVAERAAQLAAWHSKARGARGKVEVHLCRVADVRKPKGFAPGQVLLKRWDAVKVYPQGPRRAGRRRLAVEDAPARGGRGAHSARLSTRQRMRSLRRPRPPDLRARPCGGGH